MVFLRKPFPFEVAAREDGPQTDINVVSGSDANAHAGPAGTVAVTLQSNLPDSENVRSRCQIAAHADCFLQMQT